MIATTKQKVFVGLSGGVDSSVAALRLQQRGFEVVGVFIKVWHPDWLVCNWEQERLDAMRVAAHLDIPFLTCDAEAAYRDGVAQYFIEEYQRGRTPNPDVMCNKMVKFGEFMSFAKAHGADYIATGHYAQRLPGVSLAELHRGVDMNKDQSYFLWTLTPEQLAYTLLPVGDTNKDDIRAEAARAGIPTATKKDSQGVCFLGHIDIAEFLSHYTKLEPGLVEDEQGQVIGTHQGALIYTPGQRQGLTITTHENARTPYYVLSKDLARNVVVVGPQKPSLVVGINIRLHTYQLRTPIREGEQLMAQTRYRQTPFLVEVTSVTDSEVVLTPREISDQSVSGQSCVLYKDSCCVGGGIIA